MELRCGNSDCTAAGDALVACYYGPPDEGQEPDEVWCVEHAAGAGFCWSCGLFWAGCESFDFNPRGLCPNCDLEYRTDMGEFDDDDHYGEDVEDDSDIWIDAEASCEEKP